MNALLHRCPELAEVPGPASSIGSTRKPAACWSSPAALVAHTDLVRQLQARSVKRHYLALAAGRIERDGRVEAAIGRHPVHRTRMAVVAENRAARQRRPDTGPGAFAQCTLVECSLETGRTHQIPFIWLPRSSPGGIRYSVVPTRVCPSFTGRLSMPPAWGSNIRCPGQLSSGIRLCRGFHRSSGTPACTLTGSFRTGRHLLRCGPLQTTPPGAVPAADPIVASPTWGPCRGRSRGGRREPDRLRMVPSATPIWLPQVLESAWSTRTLRRRGQWRTPPLRGERVPSAG